MWMARSLENSTSNSSSPLHNICMKKKKRKKKGKKKKRKESLQANSKGLHTALWAPWSASKAYFLPTSKVSKLLSLAWS